MSYSICGIFKGLFFVACICMLCESSCAMNFMVFFVVVIHISSTVLTPFHAQN